MRAMVTGALIAIALATSATSARQMGTWKDFAGVSNTSFTEPNGDRALQLSIDVPGPQKDVFGAFATTRGFSSWAVPVAQVELKIGGIIESNYQATAKLGARDNIKNEIVAYIPNRLLVLRNVQAPRSFVDPELFQQTVTIIELTALDAGHTHVTLTNSGYGPGPRFARIYKMFEWGNAYTLAGLRRRFERGPVDWSKGEPRLQASAADDRFKGKK